MRVVIADDEPLFRDGLARLLEDAGVDVPARVGSAEELLRRVAAIRPDVAIVDIRMPPTNTNEAAISTMLDGQLYTVLGQGDEQGRWQIRLWWKPFVTLIWLGGGLIALGGALALIGRIRRERRADEAEAYA